MGCLIFIDLGFTLHLCTCIVCCVTAVADSGTQSDLWSLDKFLQAGVTMRDLLPLSLSLNAANKSPNSIDGAFFSKITGESMTYMISCEAMIYVRRDIKSMYPSYKTMLVLGILNSDFPKLSMFPNPQNK